MSEKKTKHFAVLIDEETYNLVKNYSVKLGTSISEIIRSSVKKFIENLKEKGVNGNGDKVEVENRGN